MVYARKTRHFSLSSPRGIPEDAPLKRGGPFACLVVFPQIGSRLRGGRGVSQRSSKMRAIFLSRALLRHALGEGFRRELCNGLRRAAVRRWCNCSSDSSSSGELLACAMESSFSQTRQLSSSRSTQISRLTHIIVSGHSLS